MIQEFVTNPLQKVDFKYNTRGWLKEINDINTSVQSSGNSDLFSFKLNYNTVENADGYTGTSLYNGNISETYWRSSSDAVLRKYGYQYDNLNRMTNSIYQKPENAVIVTNSYNESLAYDKNGNITALQRYGALDDAIYPVLMDDLVYTYNITGNKPNNLINVADNTNDISGFMDGTNTDADYSYDDNGNMIVDKNKNINSITYNHLNLPIRILFGNGNTIEYLYNAIGQKLNKIVREGAVSTKTEYLSGFQYKNEVLKFFSHAEGYVNYIPASGRGTVEAFNYAFNYTDHLGNIRLTYGIDPTTNVLKIMEENHYYPFGLKHTNYNTQYNVFSRNEEDQVRIAYVPPVESFYKYKFENKEWQDELSLNLYDFGARLYDPATVRTTTHDPLAEKFYNLSPQSFLNNNPMYFVDPTGMSADGWITSIVDGEKTIAYNSTVNTVEEAKAAGYENATAVNAAMTVSMEGEYSYNLNADGSVTDASGSKLVATDNLMSFTTGAGTKISSWGLIDIFKEKPMASGACTPMEFSSPFFSWGWAAKGLGYVWGSVFGTATADTGMAGVRALGVAGEDAVGIGASKTRIPSLTGTAKYRIPDRLTSTTLEEVKNVQSLSFTRQLQDFHLYSQQNSLQMILHTRPETTFSAPLQTLINNGSIINKTIPVK